MTGEVHPPLERTTAIKKQQKLHDYAISQQFLSGRLKETQTYIKKKNTHTHKMQAGDTARQQPVKVFKTRSMVLTVGHSNEMALQAPSIRGCQRTDNGCLNRNDLH